MKFNQKIVRRIIALMLIISTMFSLTSCMFDFSIFEYFLDEDYQGDGEGGEQIPDGGFNGGTITPPSGNVGQFYPGSGKGDTENVPALQQTLLSTVVVVAEFLLSHSAGSGVVYSVNKDKGDAYIITNYHIIHDATYGISKNIYLYLYGMQLQGYEVNAEFIGGSINYDIAVLKVSGSKVIKNSYIKAADLGDSESVKVFDTVYTVGNPEGLGLSVNKGIVSVESENIQIESSAGSYITLRVIRVDAPVNAGNSGGGLYGDDGKLLGIVCAKRVGDEIDNMGYAIPVNLAKNLAENIIYHCNGSTVTQLNRPMLGITITAYVSGVIVDPESGDLSQAQLVEVSEVSSTGLAAGKIAVGDIIKSVSVDGVVKNVTQTYQIPEHILTARVGSKVILTVDRGGIPLSINFVITEDSITLEK